MLGSLRQTGAMPWYVKRLLIPGLVIVMIVAIVAAVRIGSGRETPEIPGIVSLVPGPGENVLVQSPVGLVLRPDYDAALEINGVAIPPDQIEPPLNPGEVLFKPGIGKVIDELLPDRNCVTAEVWRRDLGRAEASTRDWCFRAN